jgi:Right handed beta helix region
MAMSFNCVVPSAAPTVFGETKHWLAVAAVRRPATTARPRRVVSLAREASTEVNRPSQPTEQRARQADSPGGDDPRRRSRLLIAAAATIAVLLATFLLLTREHGNRTPSGSPGSIQPQQPTPTAVTGTPRTLSVSSDGTGDFTKIASATAAAHPGDTISIRGGVYREALVPQSGIAGKVITYQAAAGAAVTLDGSGGVAKANGLVNMDGVSYVDLVGITVADSRVHGIYGANVSHVSVRDCKVHGSRDGGIAFVGGSDVTVDRADVYDNNRAAIGQRPDNARNEAVSISDITTFEVSDSRVHGNAKEGIDAKNRANHGSIHDNLAYDNAGFQVYVDGATHVDVYANHVYNYANTTGMSGIHLAVEAYVTPRECTDIRIYNNLLEGNNATFNFWIEATGRFTNIEIVNNTVYSVNTNGWGMFYPFNHADSFSGKLVLRNNIFWAAPGGVSGASLINDHAGVKGKWVIDHNAFPAGVPSDTLGSAAVTTSDIRFQNAGDGDFRLIPDSPAVHSGSAEDAPDVDIVGNVRPFGDGYDIGAYELSAAGSRRPALRARTSNPPSQTDLLG